MFPREMIFSGQELEGFVVFRSLHADVDNLTLTIHGAVTRFDYRDEPVEMVDISYRFGREIGRLYPGAAASRCRPRPPEARVRRPPDPRLSPRLHSPPAPPAGTDTFRGQLSRYDGSIRPHRCSRACWFLSWKAGGADLGLQARPVEDAADVVLDAGQVDLDADAAQLLHYPAQGLDPRGVDLVDPAGVEHEVAQLRQPRQGLDHLVLEPARGPEVEVPVEAQDGDAPPEGQAVVVGGDEMALRVPGEEGHAGAHRAPQVLQEGEGEAGQDAPVEIGGQAEGDDEGDRGDESVAAGDFPGAAEGLDAQQPEDGADDDHRQGWPGAGGGRGA